MLQILKATTIFDQRRFLVRLILPPANDGVTITGVVFDQPRAPPAFFLFQMHTFLSSSKTRMPAWLRSVMWRQSIQMNAIAPSRQRGILIEIKSTSQEVIGRDLKGY